MKRSGRWILAGALAGAVNGLFGGGGGMPLAVMLTLPGGLETKKAYANCVAVIFPLCAVSAAVYLMSNRLELTAALPYLVGGFFGGIAGGKLYGRVSALWLRRIFAAFLLYGAVRYLW